MNKFIALSIFDLVFIMLINVKMPTIVGILKFMIRACSCELSRKKHFKTSGQGLTLFANPSVPFSLLIVSENEIVAILGQVWHGVNVFHFDKYGVNEQLHVLKILYESMLIVYLILC